MLKSLRNWWQFKTGVEDKSIDGDLTAFVSSLLVHLGLLIALGLVPFLGADSDLPLTLTTSDIQEDPDELEITEAFYFNNELPEAVGANSEDGVDIAASEAAVLDDNVDVPSPVEMMPQPVGEIYVNNAVTKATGKNFNAMLAVKGHVGQNSTGAEGAIDRITHEIMLSLEERRTMVVWILDQSGSLNRQRQAIHDRLDRIYRELGLIEATGHKGFKDAERPLLTSVYAFGKEVTLRTPKPTDNVKSIKEAVAGIPQDDSGTENVFSAVFSAASRYRRLRSPGADGEPQRNVMLIVVTDEVGDDQNGVDSTVNLCRKLEMPRLCRRHPRPIRTC